MRRAHNDTDFFIEDGVLKGICLGYDFCAEHEWGIKGIKGDFGIGEKAKIGLDSCRTTRTPENFVLIKKSKKEAVLGRLNKWDIQQAGIEKAKNYLIESNELAFYGDKDLTCAWDERDFAIHVKGEENVKHLESIYKSFQENNIVVGMKQGGWVLGKGLTFCFYDSFDEEFKKTVLESHKSEQRLQDFVKKSGIHEKLKESGCKFFALSPSWRDEKEKEVRFWLNPMDQKNNRYGYVSMEDLEAWAKGEGRIPVKKRSEKEKQYAGCVDSVKV